MGEDPSWWYVPRRTVPDYFAGLPFLRLTAKNLQRLGIIDRIVAEPLGGAQRAPKAAVEGLGEAVDEALRPLLALDGSTLRLQRREKFLAMGGRGL